MRRLLAALLLPALVLTGCGGAGTGLATTRIMGEEGKKPKVVFDKPFTVEKTERKIVKEGKGAPVKVGDKVKVNYVGINGKDGKEFDANFDPKNPVTFTLADGQMIKGFVNGLKGAKVGSRVEIAIPPADGYGAEGQPSAGIGKDDTLIFVVDILSKVDVLTRAKGSNVKQIAGNPQVTWEKSGEPKITMPKGPAPAEPASAMIIKGTGKPVKAGETITAHYVVSGWNSGKVIESSWQKGQTADMQLGGGRLLPALEAAIVNKPIGSQVMAVVPQPKGISTPGANGQPTSDGKADALVFVIDILGASG